MTEKNDIIKETIDRIKKFENRRPNFLFVCKRNEQRSPTIEKWFQENRKQLYNVRSAGTQYGHPYTISNNPDDTIIWADIIFVTDLELAWYIESRFPEHKDKIQIIGISDEYYYNQPKLKNIIHYWVNKREI